MALNGIPPGPGTWTIRLGKPSGRPGLYSLTARDATESVYSGDHYLRFETSENAVGYLASFTDLYDEATAIRALDTGSFVEASGSSDIWLPLMYTLYYAAGPLFAFNAAAFHADGGIESSRVGFDPETPLPEGFHILRDPHERDDPGILVSPDPEEEERRFHWSSFSFERSISDILHPVVEIFFDDGQRKKFVLTVAPFRRMSDHSVLFTTPEGEYRIEWVSLDGESDEDPAPAEASGHMPRGPWLGDRGDPLTRSPLYNFPVVGKMQTALTATYRHRDPDERRPLEQLEISSRLEVGLALSLTYCIGVRTNWLDGSDVNWTRVDGAWQEGFVLPAGQHYDRCLAALVKTDQLDPRVPPVRSALIDSCSSPVQPWATEAVLELWDGQRPFLSVFSHLAAAEAGELVDIGDLEEAELAELQLLVSRFSRDVYQPEGPESFQLLEAFARGVSLVAEDVLGAVVDIFRH